MSPPGDGGGAGRPASGDPPAADRRPPKRDGHGSLRASLHKLHRDLGFFAFGLTIVYAVSGVAVNHREHWNYNQSTELRATRVGTPAELLPGLDAARRAELEARPGAVTDAEEKALVAGVTAALHRPGPPRNAFFRGPDRLSLFFGQGDADTVDYHPTTGVAENKIMRDRWVFRAVNFLHLNEGRRFWTWVADAFAGVLAFLAISGVIMTKGKGGLRGRGGALAAAGIVVPLLGLLLLRWL